MRLNSIDIWKRKFLKSYICNPVKSKEIRLLVKIPSPNHNNWCSFHIFSLISYILFWFFIQFTFYINSVGKEGNFQYAPLILPIVKKTSSIPAS